MVPAYTYFSKVVFKNFIKKLFMAFGKNNRNINNDNKSE